MEKVALLKNPPESGREEEREEKMAVVTARFLRAASYIRVTTIGITRAKRGQLETAKDPFNFLSTPRRPHNSSR